MTTSSAVLLCRIILAPLTVGTVHFVNIFSCLTKKSSHVQYATHLCSFWHGIQGLFRPWQPCSRRFSSVKTYRVRTILSPVYYLINKCLLQHTAHFTVKRRVKSFSVTESHYMDHFTGTPCARLPIFLKFRQETSATNHIPLAMTTKIKLKQYSVMVRCFSGDMRDLKCFLLKYDPPPHPCKLCALLFYWSSASCDLMVFSASVYFTVWLSVLPKINLILFLSHIAFTYLGTIGKKFLVAQNKQMKKKKRRKM